MTKGYETLDTVIRELIFSKKMNTLHRYPYYYLWAVKGLREFKIEKIIKDYKIVELTMDARKIVEYPEDMIDWNAIGVKIGDRYESFINDESLALIHDKGQNKPNEPYVDQKFNQASELYPYYSYYTTAGTEIDLQYRGRGHSWTGYMRMNEKKREIQFVETVDRGKIYLEYVTDAVDFTTETLIPVIATKMMEDWILYRESRYRHGENDSRTQRLKLAWEESFMEVDGRQSDITYAGLRNIVARNMSYTKN